MQSRNSKDRQKHLVGEMRPSQLLLSYGVGAIIDLPNISTLVMGLEDWDTRHSAEIGEERLLQAVQTMLGTSVKSLLSPPVAGDQRGNAATPFLDTNVTGVPVAPFPRWLLCPKCRLLAPLDSDLFELLTDSFHPDRTRFVHRNCTKGTFKAPTVVPARFLVACEGGHLDDFPWLWFVHQGKLGCKARLRLREFGVSGEATDIQVECETCDQKRRMSDAFRQQAPMNLPSCAGRRPHLRDYEEQECDKLNKAILLGASNSWFALLLSTLSIPVSVDRLSQLVDEHWAILAKTVSQQNIELLRLVGQLGSFSEFSDADIWAAVERKKNGESAAEAEYVPLKVPEWRMLSNPWTAGVARDFKVTPVSTPPHYAHLLKQVLQVERLREVHALVGFTRIQSPGDYEEAGEMPDDRRARLTRKDPVWVPATEIRGEGLFLEFNEAAIIAWLAQLEIQRQQDSFYQAHVSWRKRHRLSYPEQGFPGIRYVLLHSFSHALMRQFALECGYTSASMRERIYSLNANEPHGPMAGILIYTAAPDSEGTLGGLVNLGTPERLGLHITEALEQMKLCASDPLCAEHSQGDTLHAAACHACLFGPETSCERGNKYLDRGVLVRTVLGNSLAFFREA